MDRIGSMDDAVLSTPAEKARLGVLDGLRAMAIILVMFCHTSIYVNASIKQPLMILGNRHVAWFLMNGWVGVNLFFVLSGFLITRQLLPLDGKIDRLTFLGRYLKRRVFRIAPAYYLVMTLIGVGVTVQQRSAGSSDPETLALTWVYHLLFLHRYFGLQDLAFWSLVTEVRFYLLAPFIVLLMLRLKLRDRCLILTTAYVLLSAVNILVPPPPDYTTYFFTFIVPFHSSVTGLLAGMLCCFMWSNDKVRTSLGSRPYPDLIFTAGALMFLSLTAGVVPANVSGLEGVNSFSEIFYIPLIGVAFSLMLMGLLSGCACSRLFENRLLRGIAIVSYSIYLIHNIFSDKIVMLAQSWLGAGESATLLWLMVLAIMVTYTVPFALLLYYLVEKPFIDWAHKGNPPGK